MIIAFQLHNNRNHRPLASQCIRHRQQQRPRPLRRRRPLEARFF